MSGVLPLRASGVGMMPNDGAQRRGGVERRASRRRSLPRLFNPDRGFITSSNNQIDRQWSGLITRDWAAPYRTTRLHAADRRGGRPSICVKAAEWQNDVAGLGPTDVLAGVEAALTAGKQRSADAAALDVLSQLRAWDKRVDDRPVVTLYHLFEDQLWRRTFFDEMGDPLFSRFYEWAGAERPAGLYAILDDPGSRWFDDIATLGQRRVARRHLPAGGARRAPPFRHRVRASAVVG